MKLAIISDIHFGVNYGKPPFVEYQKRYFNDFWKTIDEQGIDNVLFLGDFFHSRKMVNYDTLELAVKCWFEPAMERGTHIFMLVGNHDVFYKNTNRLNSLDLLCWNKNIKVISSPKTIRIDERSYCFIPWINVENQTECVAELENTQASVVLSHLELQLDDNPHIKGQIDIDKLARFSHVFSGHFHSPCVKDITGCTLRYLGSPYEMNWNDFGIEDRGFYIFDDVTKETTLIKNERTIHHYFKLGEDCSWIEPWHSVRCIVPNNMSNTDYEIATQALKSKNVMKVQMIAEETKEDDTEKDELEIGQELDILQVVLKYADANKGTLDGERLNTIIKGLWEDLKVE